MYVFQNHILKKLWLLGFCVILSFKGFTQNQSQFQLSYKKDIPLVLAGVSGIVITRILENKLPGLSQTQIDNLSQQNYLDRTLSPANYNKSFHKFSDGMIFVEIVSSITMLSLQTPKDQKFPALVMAVEGYLINQAITDIVKLIVKRPRPFLYSQDVLYDKFDPDARLSFPSGHTANAAMFGFLTTSILSQLDLINPKVGRISAIVIPIVMGISRVYAGKHYFTDVLVGGISGASIGLFIPYVHKLK